MSAVRDELEDCYRRLDVASAERASILEQAAKERARRMAAEARAASLLQERDEIGGQFNRLREATNSLYKAGSLMRQAQVKYSNRKDLDSLAAAKAYEAQFDTALHNAKVLGAKLKEEMNRDNKNQ